VTAVTPTPLAHDEAYACLSFDD